MQAIITKYYGPTNTRGSRIKASADAGTVTVSYRSDLNQERAHAYAAETLRNNLGWEGEMVQGWLPDGTGYAFVFVEGSDRI